MPITATGQMVENEHFSHPLTLDGDFELNTSNEKNNKQTDSHYTLKLLRKTKR